MDNLVKGCKIEPAKVPAEIEMYVIPTEVIDYDVIPEHRIQ